MSEMYQEVILDYYRHPRNFGTLKGANLVSHDVNTSCGDEIQIEAKVENGIVKQIMFSGNGCAISKAAASMLTEFVQGKNIEEVLNLQKEEILNMVGIEISPMRLKCALLGFKVLKMGAIKFMEGQHGN